MKQRISYNEKVSKILEPPYFHNMEEQFGITDTNDQLEVLKFIYGNDVRITSKCIYDSNDNNIYFENNFGYWRKRKYDYRGKNIYNEDSSGDSNKKEYDENGNCIYFEDNLRYFEKCEYDSNNMVINWSNGYRQIE